jgi:hypothetical protein
MESKVIWLASYPRSGNTLLRTILWHCFGLRSASLYPNDLGGNRDLENYVGHIEHGPDGQPAFPGNSPFLIKTHENPADAHPAIYIVRDGRAVCASMWRFYREQYPIEAIVEGQHRFGTWSSHVASWNPWDRPDTLLVKYENMTDNLRGVLETISLFLGRAILTDRIPDRDTMANIGGRWVRRQGDWKSVMSGTLLERFYEINGEMLRKLDYLS